MVTGGYGCDTNGDAGTNANNTYLDTSNTIDSNGSIKSWCVYVRNTNSNEKIKLKIFRLNGSNYDLVWSSDLMTMGGPAGSHTFSLDSAIPVLSGDYVGYYSNAFNVAVDSTSPSSGSVLYQSGDILQQTTTASWSNALANNLRVRVSSDTGTTLYVKTTGDNSKSGSNWADAKKDIKDGLRFIGTSGTCRIGFGDYSADSGIKFDKTVSMLCETATTGGGTGTVNLPRAAWSQCDFTNVALDRSNTVTDAFADFTDISMVDAIAQRFIPASRCLNKVTLKLKRVLDNDVYVEIRNDSSGSPQGNPHAGTGQVDYVVVPYTSISTLTLTEVDVTFDVDMSDTNPKWIVVSLNSYDPNGGNYDSSCQIAGSTTNGTRTEYMATKYENGSWSVGATHNLYYKTYRGI